MCGRVALFSPPARVARFTHALESLDSAEWRPRWNVPPQRPVFVVREEDGARRLVLHQWGLVPGWAKDPSMGARLANARAETVAEKPSFRRAFLDRPCVLPVDGYYEWRVGPQGAKLPHFFTRRDEEPLLLAGLFEQWRSTSSDEVLLTCCVITTEPSSDVVEVHDRMPVVLDSSDLDAWLQGDATLRHTLLRPAPSGTLHHHEVSRLVNSTRHDGPHLINPEGTASLF